MHAVSPGFVLDLCKKIYSKSPKTYLLHLKGYEFEFMEEITEKASENLDAGFEFMKKKILEHLNEV
jgi:ferritin-like protein